jgi:hypothetical protein
MARESLSVHTNADAQMVTGKSRLIGVLYTSAGGSLDHIKLYDGTSAAGRLVLELDTTKQGVVTWNLPEGGLSFSTGLYCDIGGATSCTVLYQD